MELDLKEKLFEAEKKAEEIIKEAEEKTAKALSQEKKELEESKKTFFLREERLLERERFIDEKEQRIQKEGQKLEEEKKFFNTEKQKLKEEKAFYLKKLENLAGLEAREAYELLLENIKKEKAEELFVKVQKLENQNKDFLEKKASEIIALAVQRLSLKVSNPLLSSVVDIPNEETKGKVIGKDGRNIRTFERVSGVQLIIDETPGVITISCFDPVRREVAKRALEYLILDDRIQPARIEEFLEKSSQEVTDFMRKKAKEVLAELSLYNMPDQIIDFLGRLYFRTSYGQNVLKHSLETAHIAKVLASELKADVQVAKTAALLHDIGKALDHSMEGSHVEIGIKLLRQNGINESVISAMKSHHNEYPAESLEALIVETADSISGARPGARSETAEMYIQKLENLEKVSKELDGVLSAYALSAGRELRVFVEPEKVDDFKASEIAKQIAKRIEEEMTFPGEIKVAVIRETRIIEFAR